MEHLCERDTHPRLPTSSGYKVTIAVIQVGVEALVIHSKVVDSNDASDFCVVLEVQTRAAFEGFLGFSKV